jgi:hypothetical protein
LLIFFFALGPYLRWLLLELLLDDRDRLDFFGPEDRDVPRCEDVLLRLLLDELRWLLDFLRPLLRCDALDRRCLPLLRELDLRAVAMLL